uniref:Uncharacterized protein n=1 Tax=Heterorhabditis bacteriophora TaxID=37862 RepID=A0A1I7WX54_HETBA
MAAVVANQPVQPMRFGGGVAGASNVTLTISPAQSNLSSGAGGNNFYKRQGGYRFQQPINMANDIMMMGDGPGRRLRKNVANVRRHVDYVATVLNHADCKLIFFIFLRILMRTVEYFKSMLKALSVLCFKSTVSVDRTFLILYIISI